METPQPYGWFHLMFCALSVLAAILLCVLHDPQKPERVRRVVLITTIIVILLEIYKQINYSFSYENGIVYDYQWYIFPWQFCSMPMYVGLAAGLTRRGRVHDALCAFLATYAIFAGVCVMAYPTTIYTGTLGINIQTSICHGSMIAVGIYLLYSGYVKLRHRTMLGAMAVFACLICVAILLNEIAFRTGLTAREDFNMFFISPYQEPHLPVYSTVQQLVPYPFCLLLYFGGFSLAAYLILLAAMGIRALARKARRSTQA